MFPSEIHTPVPLIERYLNEHFVFIRSSVLRTSYFIEPRRLNQSSAHFTSYTLNRIDNKLSLPPHPPFILSYELFIHIHLHSQRTAHPIIFILSLKLIIMKGKRIVVTGGGGFIGSNIVKSLMHDNEVIVVDDFSTGRRENLAGIEDQISLMEGSITDLDFLMSAFRDVDYVLHQAALPSVPRSVDDPITSNFVNVNGTMNVLVAARDSNVEKVVFAASSSAYGDTPTLPKVETMPTNPLSPYAVTKVTGEQYMKVFNDVYGLRTTALRYFNVFGPGQDPTSQYSAVIPKFVKWTINNESPSIYGDGEQSRDFTFVKDTIQANIKAAESKGVDGEVVNIAKGDRTTVNDLARMILEDFGKADVLKPHYIPPLPGDVKHSLADISKARELMNFEPLYTLEDGLKETLQYFRAYYGVE